MQVKLVLLLDMGSVPSLSQACPKFVPSSSQIKDLIVALDTQYHSLSEIMDLLGGTNKTRFRKEYILPAIEQGVIERKYPKTPNHPQQRYRLTAQTQVWKDKGNALLRQK